jgi:hypothetical protein
MGKISASDLEPCHIRGMFPEGLSDNADKPASHFLSCFHSLGTVHTTSDRTEQAYPIPDR